MLAPFQILPASKRVTAERSRRCCLGVASLKRGWGEGRGGVVLLSTQCGFWIWSCYLEQFLSFDVWCSLAVLLGSFASTHSKRTRSPIRGIWNLFFIPRGCERTLYNCPAVACLFLRNVLKRGSKCRLSIFSFVVESGRVGFV